MQTIKVAETQAALTNAHYKGGWKHQPLLQWLVVRAVVVSNRPYSGPL